MQAIGTNLRRLRVRAGLTQDALAGMLHVTRQTVSSWEIGRTEPDLDTLLALAEALHCDATELIYGVKRNGYQQYQRRWIVCSMVCGAVLLALLVLQLVLVPALEARQGMTYSLTYSIYRLCVPQLGFFTGGILLCALASVWLPVRVAGNGRRWLLAAGILSALPPLDLVVGRFNPNREKLEQYASEQNNVVLHCDVKDMAGLMTACQLAVTAGGTTIYELSVLGVPFVCFSYAENQEGLTEWLGKQEIAGYAGKWHYTPEETRKAIGSWCRNVCENRELRQRTYEAERTLIDGQGAARIAEILQTAGIEE